MNEKKKTEAMIDCARIPITHRQRQRPETNRALMVDTAGLLDGNGKRYK